MGRRDRTLAAAGLSPAQEAVFSTIYSEGSVSREGLASLASFIVEGASIYITPAECESAIEGGLTLGLLQIVPAELVARQTAACRRSRKRWTHCRDDCSYAGGVDFTKRGFTLYRRLRRALGNYPLIVFDKRPRIETPDHIDCQELSISPSRDLCKDQLDNETQPGYLTGWIQDGIRLRRKIIYAAFKRAGICRFNRFEVYRSCWMLQLHYRDYKSKLT